MNRFHFYFAFPFKLKSASAVAKSCAALALAAATISAPLAEASFFDSGGSTGGGGGSGGSGVTFTPGGGVTSTPRLGSTATGAGFFNTGGGFFGTGTSRSLGSSTADYWSGGTGIPNPNVTAPSWYGDQLFRTRQESPARGPILFGSGSGSVTVPNPNPTVPAPDIGDQLFRTRAQYPARGGILFGNGGSGSVPAPPPATGGTVIGGGNTGGGSLFGGSGGGGFFGGRTSGSVPFPSTGGSGNGDTIYVSGYGNLDRATLNRMIDTGEIYYYLNRLTPEQRQRLLEAGIIDVHGNIDSVRINELFDTGAAADATVSANSSGDAVVSSPTLGTASLSAAGLGQAAAAGSSRSGGGGFFNTGSVPASETGEFDSLGADRSIDSSFSALEAAALATTTDSDLVIVAYGDSVIRGVGTTAGNDFVSRLEDSTGRTIINAGQSGLTTYNGYYALDTAVLPYNPDIVILFIGGNDILQGVSREITISNIREIIKRLQAQGATVVLMGIHGQIFIVDYETGYQQIAAETGALYVPNVLQGILGNQALMSDAIHPNDAGHAVIAERVEPTLETAIDIEDDQQTTSLQATCRPDRAQAEVGTNVTWIAEPTGGTGTYSYAWSGTDNLSSNFRTASITYNSAGAKTASVRVISGTASTTANCSVQIGQPSLVGSCAVSVGQNAAGNPVVRWTAFAAGASGNYTYSWSGTDGLSTATTTAPSVEMTYSTPGQKTANVTITSGGVSRTLSCGANLPAPSTATSTVPLAGSCVVSGPLAINRELRWAATPVSGSYSYAWSGTDGLSANTSDIRKSYSTTGTKTGTVALTHVPSGKRLDMTCQALIAETAPGAGGIGGLGCFVATAAYGTPMEPEVATLRKFRDEYLLTNDLGKKFVEFYYANSPPIADAIRDNEKARAAVRGMLAPILFIAEKATAT